ncbi:hypothetical protein BKA67DRAFT_166410 [Truncatella angustata]|uniref:CID domain-containing protein n=1 Tax=Truncatella angustata TaxID=152316 RepID=A0A9P8UR96_9PEZI|nr:uncharacterized protein BKA67DRAFT_166410 [Truncatella angustata]KAH6656746.1 hypothetical protein BKA67DRAFT_166410 [Truncatella angustata]
MASPEAEALLEDFREALEGLQINSRYEIQNLTQIARESTEHALDISQALQDHIKKAAPHKKLPALYVLDSISKNVGTPYTLFFAKRLYTTFWESYAVADGPTRRKMHEMFKTWKEPIPGSIDRRPVFPPEVTQPIENALIRATASGNEQVRRLAHGQGRPAPQQGVPYRDTSTPPAVRPSTQMNGYPGNPTPIPIMNGSPYGLPAQPAPAQYPYQNQHIPSTSTPQPPSTVSAFQPPSYGGYGIQPQPLISVDALKDDIQNLISAFRAEFARNPGDPSIQTKLKALLDLQGILQAHNLPQEQLMAIKNQIAGLAVTVRATPAQTPTPVPVPQSVAVAPPPAPAPVSIDSLLGSGALAALLARSSATPQVPTPQPPPAAVVIRSPPTRHVEPQPPVVATTPNPMALMEMLRKAGVLPAAMPASNATPVPNIKPSLPLSFPPPIPTGPPSLENLTRDIDLKPSSLKQHRPHLVPLMFEALGSQCTHCGRRFTPDEEGKKKKTAHMDWHFRVNQRIADAEKSGQHRSWFVDEADWINSRETIDEDRATNIDSSSAQNASSKAPKMQYIPVPSDPALKNSICPICQENFKQIYLDDAGDWVWEDAIQVEGRIYHASCHQEVTGGLAQTATVYRSTPEPVLGKRKAEDELAGLRGKMKLEAA